MEPRPVPPEAAAPPRGADEEAFLLRLADLLQAYGTPAFRLERVLRKLADALGVEAAFLSTPTAVMASVGPPGAASVRLIRSDSGEVDLGKLVEFDEVMEDVEHHRVSPVEGLLRLEDVASRGSRYRLRVRLGAFGLASAGAACFFGGGAGEIGFSFVLGAFLLLVLAALPPRPDAVGVFEPLAAFLAGLAATLGGRAVFGLDDRVITLASLIVLLPGLTLTVGFTELATRHLVSGMSRVAGAGVVFLTLLFGVALGWRVGGLLAGALDLELVATPAAGGWSPWLAALTGPIAFAVLLGARPREFPVIWVVGVAGYSAALFASEVLGADLAPFAGALVVGLGANLYARAANRPAIVPSTPGIFLLVPGSIGFRSLTSFLDADSITGVSWAFRTSLVASALVGGLLVANLVLPPRRVM